MLAVPWVARKVPK
jgi:hypothetical protein